MSKEKLTVESIRKRIEESIEWNLGGKAERKEKVLTESILIVESFLKQIRDEVDECLFQSKWEYNRDFAKKKNDINEVFNKYLN